MDNTIEEEGPPEECSQGLCHLWFGFRNPAIKAFQMLQQGGHSIQKVSMGQKHCAFLTVYGQVFTYGNNNSGQLGNGNYEDQYLEPVFVEEICDSFIVDISCGKWHSAAVSSTGQVYCWGNSTHGQCGNQITTNPLPVKVNLVKRPSVSDGNFHSDKDAKLKNGQRNSVQSNPTKDQDPLQEECKDLPDNEDCREDGVRISVKIVQVECGGSHTLAICDQGELWGWGCGTYLGLNISENITCFIPRRIDFMAGRKVIKVSCGERHTLSLVQKLPLSSQLHRHNENHHQHHEHKVKSERQQTSKKSTTKGGVKSKESSTNLEIDRQTCQSSMCEQCHSPVRKPKGSCSQYEEDEDTLHVCPLGLEITSEGNRPQMQIQLSSSQTGKSPRASRLSLDSRSLDTDSTCSELDPLGGGVYQTAENSPLMECKNVDRERVIVAKGNGSGTHSNEIEDTGDRTVEIEEKEESRSGNMKDENKMAKTGIEKTTRSKDSGQKDEVDNFRLTEVNEDISGLENRLSDDIKEVTVFRLKEEKGAVVENKDVDDNDMSEDGQSTRPSYKDQTSVSSDYINIELSSSQTVTEAAQEYDDVSSQNTEPSLAHTVCDVVKKADGSNSCDIGSAILSYEHNIGGQAHSFDGENNDHKYRVVELSKSELCANETDNIPVKYSSSTDDVKYEENEGKVENESKTISSQQDSNEVAKDDQANGDILQDKLASPKPSQLSTRDSSDSLLGSLTKSRSTFLDETEAKEFLDRQLSGDDVLVVDATTGEAITTPLTKKVENILQYVPNTSTAMAMQEYVRNWTSTVVTNIRSQVETTMDRFGIVSSLGASLDAGEELGEEEVKGQGSGRDPEEVELGQEQVVGEVGSFQRFGSLPKSTSLGGINSIKAATESRHKRRGSLPSGAIQSSRTAIFSNGEVVMETEVWSWGDGGQGQLGHGDTLDRFQPCKIKFFSDKKVVDISAGNFHNLVLTANSQVYSWGCNTCRQLGHQDVQATTSPQKVKIGRGLPVSDIATGESHSVVLVDDQNFCPAVYYCGTEPGKPGAKEDFSDEFTVIPNLQKVGHMRSLSAGGDLCCCVSDKQTSNHRSLLYEFSASERLFGSQLHLISEELLKPLLNSDAFQSKDSSQLGMGLGILCDAFFCLADMTSQNHLELKRILGNTRDLTELQLLAKSEQCIGAFQHYCKCYTDVLAIGGFQTSAKLCSSLFAKSKDLITSILDTKTFQSKDAGTTFLKLMKLPLLRLKDYCKLLSRLALKFSSFTREKRQLDSSCKLWEIFYQVTVQDIKKAENTNLFWSTCPAKLTETLQVASRRLLFDSKTYPLTFQGGGRFTSHLFLLFNDIFAHVQGSYINSYSLSTIWLETASTDKEVATGNFIKLIMPEDTFTLLAPSPMLKSEWIWAFNQAIDRALSQQRYSNETKSNGPTLSPPRDRHASHKFSKHPVYKDAKYEGMWRSGYMHGQGELTWPDGRRFHGAFKNGSQDGYGVYTVPHDDSDKEVYDGVWRQGKLCGYGYVKYSSGDSYEGHFREGKRHGHGVLKQGKLTSTLASIYIGEWAADRKSGYGVYEDILKGQKYMGLWLEDQKHGNGVIVTLDGMYFEGTFQQNKMTGYGLLMTDDNTCYEGEFAGGPNLYGKGTLTLPNGDFIEGTFNGSFTDGIKTNGTFFKAPEDASQRHGFSHALGIIPKSFGRLSVPAHRKWEEIFDQCCGMLGCTKQSSNTDSFKAWEKCAALIEIGKKMASGSGRTSKSKGKAYSLIPPELETIPEYSKGNLSIEYYTKIKSYVTKAFEWPHHPLGRLLESLVDVYRATYVGVGAHPRLLHHAVQEVHSFLERVYPIVRILFPDLPDGSSVVQIVRENYDEGTNFQNTEEDICEVVTPGSLLYPILLPKIYPPLFTLYALYNEKEDERYWRRVVTWNKQSDLALMSYLGIDQRFWTFEDHNMESPQKLSKIRDKSYVEAIETLQGISTSFSPADKLYLIQNTFNKINKIVHDKLGAEYLWCMDDLFPVFQYVVVRARIQHLGAEIHFMDDLMEAYLEHGELGLMFTTLKASYYQIQTEKIA